VCGVSRCVEVCREVCVVIVCPVFLVSHLCMIVCGERFVLLRTSLFLAEKTGCPLTIAVLHSTNLFSTEKVHS